MTAKKVQRARTDRMSGRELFLFDASLFVDDAKAYDSYIREDEPEAGSLEQVREKSSKERVGITEQDEKLFAKDDDELDLDELDELESRICKTSLDDFGGP